MDFDEGNIRFSFDASWQVLKYDDTRLYRDGVGIIPATKAVDFIGVHGREVFFIEVKDFRDHRIENKRRIASDELPVEIAQKVRDSVAGLIGAYRTSSNSEAASLFVRGLVDYEQVIKVIVWVEYDLPAQLPKQEKVKKSVVGNVYKQKLRWLTTKVLVINSRDNALQQSGLTARNLPHLP